MTQLELAPITVLVGHAGVGKTNVALGLALLEAAAGREVALADLDVVNPYFRSSDYRELLDGAGVRLIAPVLAGTTLDTPSLTGELDAAIVQTTEAPQQRRLILDVGGDDDGATTIGRWSAQLREAQERGVARVLYVVSAFRALTTTPEEAAALLPGIEDHAHVRADGVLNTSNLGDATTMAHAERGRVFAREVAALCGLPLVATVVPAVVGTSSEVAGAPVAVGVPEVANAPETAGAKPTVASVPDSSQMPMEERTSTYGETRAKEPVLFMPRYVRLPWD